MSDTLMKKIQLIGLVPVVKIDDAAKAVPLAKAMIAGGMPVAEVTFRTAAAEEAISNIAKAVPEMLLGAGTVTSVAADFLGLQQYSRDAVHRTVLTTGAIDAANRRWLGQTTDEIAKHPLLPPLRAAVIGAGSMILAEIARRVLSGEIIVSETDILDGIAHELLDRS